MIHGARDRPIPKDGAVQPEDDEIPADERELERGELDGELGIAAEIDSVPSHLRGNRPAAAARGAGIESQRNGVAACR